MQNYTMKMEELILSTYRHLPSTCRRRTGWVNRNSLDLYSGGRGVRDSNFYRDTGLPGWGFFYLCHTLHANDAWFLPRLRHVGILLNPFNFIIHQSPISFDAIKSPILKALWNEAETCIHGAPFRKSLVFMYWGRWREHSEGVASHDVGTRKPSVLN
jgi:hypothetical protein